MSNLKAGFARIDITPPLGTTLAGYPAVRPANGILDSLMTTAVAFDNGEKKAVIISNDLLGIRQFFTEQIRTKVAEAIGTEKEAVFLHCTHTHLGPGVTTIEDTLDNEEYAQWLLTRIRDVAVLAMQDLAPAKLFYTRGEAKDVAFVRTYLMKDGTYKTHPGRLNPDIVRPAGESDDTVQLLIIKRENAPEIGIVNFQVHPDVIGGKAISADYPKFVRDTYERIIDNSRCMYINGAQGDTNDANTRMKRPETVEGRYAYARYMGRKIAMAALANYELAEPIEGDEIRYAQENVMLKYNKGRPDQLDDAIFLANKQKEFVKQGMTQAQSWKAADPRNFDIKSVANFWEARRIAILMDLPDEGELILTAVRIGDVVFAGFPGEPFTDIGRGVKNNSKFTLTIPACCANGYQGYYPMRECYDRDGYERSTARFACGTAEKLIETSTKLVNSLK